MTEQKHQAIADERLRAQAMRIVLAEPGDAEAERVARQMADDPRLCACVAEAAQFVTQLDRFGVDKQTSVSSLRPRPRALPRDASRTMAAMLAASFIGLAIISIVALQRRVPVIADPEVTDNIASLAVEAWEAELVTFQPDEVGPTIQEGALPSGDGLVWLDDSSDWIAVAVDGIAREEG